MKGGFVNPIRTRQGEGKKLPSPTLTLTLITERMMNRGMQGKCEGVRVNHVIKNNWILNRMVKNCVAVGSPCRVIKYIEND